MNEDPKKELEEFLSEGYEIKALTIAGGNYVIALQRGRKAAILHVDGFDETFLSTEKVQEIGY